MSETPVWGEWLPVEGKAYDDIIYEKKQHLEYGARVARITINRPQRYNSLTDRGLEEIYTALDDASHDDEVGAVVLTSTGEKAFCTGGDVNFEAAGGTRRIYYYEPQPNHHIRLCRKPVIAAVKGYAIGAGNHLAYFCDFTIAAENAVFGQTGPKIGSPIDGYVVNYLVDVVGAKRAREIWMLCRKYDAQQALDMGLVNTVVPIDQLDTEVDQWAEEILAKSPSCISILKATFDAKIDHLVAGTGRIGAQMHPHFFEGPEPKEGQNAFFEKRKPNFWKALRDAAR